MKRVVDRELGKVRRALWASALAAAAISVLVAGCKSKDEQVFDQWQNECNGGSLKACSQLGEAYVSGVGTPPNPAKAIELYQKACNGSESHGCGLLGKAYADGTGVAKDVVQAKPLLVKGCGLGDKDACANACDLGDADRCLSVAVIAAQGGKDPARAASYYKKACDFGHPLACREGAHLFQDGVGTPKDEAQAARMRIRADDLMKAACSGPSKPDYCDLAAMDAEAQPDKPADRRPPDLTPRSLPGQPTKP